MIVRPVPTGRNGAQERGGVAEGPSQRGWGSGLSGTSLPRVPAPVTWAPDPAAAGRSAGWWVSWSVGQWPAARFSALMFGGGRDTGAARTPEPRGEEPCTQVSGLSPHPQARCAVRTGSPRRGIAWGTESPQIQEPLGACGSVPVWVPECVLGSRTGTLPPFSG